MTVIVLEPLDRIGDKFVFAPDGCWLWTAALYENGYGAFWNHGRNHRAHRITYELLHGPVPDGLDLDHLCRVRRCVNPAHLEPVTRAENLRRAPYVQASRTRTHCGRGHELTTENTRIESGSYRRCRTCAREDTRSCRARRRAMQPSEGIGLSVT